MKTALAPALAALLCLGLAACSTSPTSMRLVDTKSPAQLLRNEAANRLITGTDEIVVEQSDSSAACKSATEDPEGLYRSWRSSLLAGVPAHSAIGVDQFVGALATSFSEDGWVFTEAHDASEKVTTMTRSDSIVTLTFTSTEDVGDGASVAIVAVGPCVLTAGPDSDEVTGLEG